MPTIVIGCAAPSFAAARAVAVFAAPAEAVPIDFSFAYIFDESTPVPSEPGVTLRGFNDVAVEDQGNLVANADTTAPSGAPGDENVIAQINGLKVVLAAERTALSRTRAPLSGTKLASSPKSCRRPMRLTWPSGPRNASSWERIYEAYENGIVGALFDFGGVANFCRGHCRGLHHRHHAGGGRDADLHLRRHN